ncbi:hypothetical protein [Novosphingobium cyanobacteriorum]|uniref:Uncharacterized protein n=1 Tax=Novosphingobium cyanobacteriorum TaxID=3024215 RepID=A0ABT6CK48_9SPHN|nr:hypothetical protein [Novosphingobium cyanobacteriorum]MDF8333938.1 hypothetical protein [Novosphingobium cyanobacteriorum]
MSLFSVPTQVLAGEPEAIKVSGKEAVKGATTVAIGAFNVGFIFESTDQTKATGGLMGAFGGTTKAKSQLVGVTPEMMQKIADAAYADFVGKLQAAGLTVQGPAAVFAAPELAKPHGHPSPLDINIQLEKKSTGKATYVKPSALPTLIMVAGDFQGSGFSSMGLAMEAGQAGMALSNYARASGSPVIDVTYLIDFSDQKRPGAFSFGGLEVNANLSVVPGYSRMTIFGANGKTTTATLQQGVSVDGDFITKEDATSGASKTTQAAGNVVGGLLAAGGMGGLRLGKTRKFEFTAKPGNYEDGATKAASLANERLVAQIAALK